MFKFTKDLMAWEVLNYYEFTKHSYGSNKGLKQILARRFPEVLNGSQKTNDSKYDEVLSHGVELGLFEPFRNENDGPIYYYYDDKIKKNVFALKPLSDPYDKKLFPWQRIPSKFRQDRHKISINDFKPTLLDWAGRLFETRDENLCEVANNFHVVFGFTGGTFTRLRAEIQKLPNYKGMVRKKPDDDNWLEKYVSELSERLGEVEKRLGIKLSRQRGIN